MKKIAILLNGEIINDYRVIKIINTLSSIAVIDLFYINGNLTEDSELFKANVNLISVNHKTTFWVNFLRHTFFCFEFNFFIKEVLRRKQTYDIIWSNDLPTLFPAYKLSKKLNSKLVYDSHEIYIETLNQFFPKKSIFFKKIIFEFLLFFMKKHGNFIENKYVKKTFKFITVNESLLDYFKEKYNLKHGCAILNCPVKNFKDTFFENLSLRKTLNIEHNTKVVIYQGVFNEGRGLRLLIEAFKFLPYDYKLLLIGSGTLQNDLRYYIIKLNLEHRIFIDFDNFEENYYTCIADVGVNLLEPLNLSKKLASPNKVFQYIHAGIPVVLSKSPENIRILKDFDIGMLTDLNPENIAKDIMQVVVRGKSFYKKEIFSARNLYNWQNEEIKLLNYLL